VTGTAGAVNVLSFAPQLYITAAEWRDNVVLALRKPANSNFCFVRCCHYYCDNVLMILFVVIIIIVFVINNNIRSTNAVPNPKIAQQLSCVTLRQSWSEMPPAVDGGLRRSSPDWSYYARGSLPPGAWRDNSASYNDADWQRGAAPLGFAADLVFATNVSQGEYITHYFRKSVCVYFVWAKCFKFLTKMRRVLIVGVVIGPDRLCIEIVFTNTIR
jgi:hypothetical protein